MKTEELKEKMSGMFWHCHHGRLCEYVWDYQGRVDYIKKYKPTNEIKTRLKLFKKIKGKLPGEFRKVDKKREEADEKLEEAYEKRKEAYAKHLPELEKLHKKECGCKEWNGKELVFKK